MHQHFSAEQASLSESNGAEATNEQYTFHELTVKQWIIEHRSHDPKNIKGALPIALKLTDFLIEAEKEEQNGHQNPIPLNIIAGSELRI